MKLLFNVRNATPAYYGIFGTEFTSAVKPLLADPKTTVPVRFNVALVVEAVAAKGYTVEPAVEQLLADHDASVVLIAERAAQPLVANLVQNPAQLKGSKLLAAVVAGAKAQLKSQLGGYVAAEAYAALIVNPATFPNAPQQAAVMPQLLPTLDPLLELLEARTLEYVDGVPTEPEAEQNVPTRLYLLFLNAPAMLPAQKTRVMQDLVDLVSAGGQRAVAASPSQYRGLVTTVNHAASAIKVLLAPAGVAAGTGGPGVGPLTTATPTTAAAKVESDAKLVYGTVTLSPAFKTLVEPPTLPAIAVVPPAK